jgi:PPOX class probable F420-dependent enzyme
MTYLKQFKDQEFLTLATFRKNGVGVKTPIWFAQEGELLLMWTDGKSGKIKRIHNNPRVHIAPFKRFGEVTGEWM